MHRALLTIALLVAVALAGCSDDGAPAANSGDEDPMDSDGPVPLEAPSWNVGDYWTYETNFGSTWTLVVTENGTSDYTVDTDDANLAFFHDQNEVSYLGAIRKSDLAGSQGSDRVVYYAFPLEDGKAWTTPWDGRTLQVTATRTGDASFTFEATADGTLVYTYAYDAADRSLSDFRGYDANGTETFTMDLVDSGTGYTGELVRIDAESFFEVESAGPDAESGVFTDWAPPQDSDVFLALDVSCQQGEVMFSMGAVESIPNTNGVVDVTENDDGITVQSACPYDFPAFFGRIGAQPANGTWGYTFHLASPDATLTATAWIAEYERIVL